MITNLVPTLKHSPFGSTTLLREEPQRHHRFSRHFFYGTVFGIVLVFLLHYGPRYEEAGAAPFISEAPPPRSRPRVPPLTPMRLLARRTLPAAP